MMGEKLAMPARHSLVGAANKTNRVFRDKPGGLVVDYLGLAHELKAALATYTESGGRGRTALDQDEAVALMLEKYEVCCGLFHGFDWSRWVTGTPQERLGLLPSAQEHILKQENARVIPIPLASADIRVRLAR
jgi:type I restriction enzyme, R subunit